MEISSTIPATSPVASPPASAAISSDFETFLRMLTVQMENQDPLNPVDSSDYAVQLATFSGVEQQVQTNDLLRNLATQLGSSGLADMAAWVGREVRAPVAGYFAGGEITLAPNPVSVADRAEIVVTNATGDEVDRFAVPISAQTIAWDGTGADDMPLPHGTYAFSLTSYAGEDILDRSAVETYNPVTEVRSQGGEMLLILGGGGAITANQVTALRSAAS